jgi:hypothetical protein
MKAMLRSAGLVLLVSAIAGCTVWPVGQDPYSLKTRRDANRVVEAIASYHQAKGTFPPTLNSLIPTYLASLPEGPKLEYNALDGSISYHYIPSWPQLHWTWCSSVGDTTEWRCVEKMT